MKTTFTQNYHLPFLVFLLTTSWLLIVLRIRSFHQQRVSHRNKKWRTMQGLSVIFTISAGVFSSVYVILNIALWALNQDIYNIFNPANGDEAPDLSTLPKETCLYVIRVTAAMVDLACASRFFLLLVLWTVKGSLMAVYYNGRAALIFQPKSMGTLHLSCPILIVTLAVSLWIAIQGMVSSSLINSLSVSDVRSGFAIAGITYEDIGDVQEIILSVLNLSTDALLTFLAYKLIGSLKICSPASGWLLMAMGSTTILLAFIRIICALVVISCTEDACYEENGLIVRLMTPLMVLGELEAFVATMVSCLPGLRATLRKGGNTEKDLGGNSPRSSSFGSKGGSRENVAMRVPEVEVMSRITAPYTPRI